MYIKSGIIFQLEENEFSGLLAPVLYFDRYKWILLVTHTLSLQDVHVCVPLPYYELLCVSLSTPSTAFQLHLSRTLTAHTCRPSANPRLPHVNPLGLTM